MAEVDKDAAEILAVFVDAVILGADMGLIQKAKNPFFELAATLAGNDLDQGNAFIHRFFDDAVQLGVDGVALVVDVVEIQFELCHEFLRVGA